MPSANARVFNRELRPSVGSLALLIRSKILDRTLLKHHVLPGPKSPDFEISGRHAFRLIKLGSGRSHRKIEMTPCWKDYFLERSFVGVLGDALLILVLGIFPIRGSLSNTSSQAFITEDSKSGN